MKDDPLIFEKLLDETKGLQQHAAEHSLYSFKERMFVMQMLTEADRERNRVYGRSATEAELEVVERLAWALYDAVYWSVALDDDDLDGIDEALDRIDEF